MSAKQIRIHDKGEPRTLGLLDWSFEGNMDSQRYVLKFKGETWAVEGCVLPRDAPPDEIVLRGGLVETRSLEEYKNPEAGMWLKADAVYHKPGVEHRFNCHARAVFTAGDKQGQAEAVDIRAALREELNEHPLLSEVTSKAEATQADILREAVNIYKKLSPDKSAVLAAYLDKGSITGAVEVTGFSRGKVHKLLLDIEREQGVQIIHRRRGLEGEHIGDSYRHNGRTRNRTHRAG